jgi:hypothetical protein
VVVVVALAAVVLVAPAAVVVVVSDSGEAQLARTPRMGRLIPTTMPRRMNSRRLIFPAEYSSMRWFSIGVLRRLIASTRR